VPLGIYISVPFCKSKCSYCNFASGVFSRERMQGYVERLCADIAGAEQLAEAAGGRFAPEIDSIYFGGGTPSILEPLQMEQIFSALRSTFRFLPGSEITVECAPGTISDSMLESLLRSGVNRVSLGVQSFVDEEARSVGRLHTRDVVFQDIARLRAAGIHNLNADLIAGLPHQDKESWQGSLQFAIESGVPHVSIYMLEVDEDSRLGRELLAGGVRYHAHFVPAEEKMAEFYVIACEQLENAGIRQYEISNFARAGRESRHNLKYWTRQPYFGFGVDAHSMLLSSDDKFDAIRLAMPDTLEAYATTKPGAAALTSDVVPATVSSQAAWEETFFLGLRLNRGVDLRRIERHFGADAAERARQIALELLPSGFIEFCDDGNGLRLTLAGRLASNEVFQEFLLGEEMEKPVARNLAAVSNTLS